MKIILIHICSLWILKPLYYYACINFYSSYLFITHFKLYAFLYHIGVVIGVIIGVVRCN